MFMSREAGTLILKYSALALLENVTNKGMTLSHALFYGSNSLALDEQAFGVFDQVFDFDEELHGFASIHDAVIIG